ncbi:hypothetical protein B0T16DRAFT_419704 [Cercophora newfieldiana]|uniref:Uncharacterized protein n=1 Tax=Cercophora newfieldiana TaxID=92897 RepID=A0AA39XW45_9PEZI|nr:hypothetical protein B0T16DRAFT_419704 [Cercophora newfieldiana]
MRPLFPSITIRIHQPSSLLRDLRPPQINFLSRSHKLDALKRSRVRRRRTFRSQWSVQILRRQLRPSCIPTILWNHPRPDVLVPKTRGIRRRARQGLGCREDLDLAATSDARRRIELEPAVLVLGAWIPEGQEGAEGVRVRRLFVHAGARGGAGIGQWRPTVVAVVDADGVCLGFNGGGDDEGNLFVSGGGRGSGCQEEKGDEAWDHCACCVGPRRLVLCGCWMSGSQCENKSMDGILGFFGNSLHLYAQVRGKWLP